MSTPVSQAVNFTKEDLAMFGLLDSLIDLTKDVAQVVTAPLEIVVDVADAAVKPIADAAKGVVDDVKSLKD